MKLKMVENIQIYVDDDKYYALWVRANGSKTDISGYGDTRLEALEDLINNIPKKGTDVDAYIWNAIVSTLTDDEAVDEVSERIYERHNDQNEDKK